MALLPVLQADPLQLPTQNRLTILNPYNMAKSILIIGGSGAQGSAVVHFLSSTRSYELKYLPCGSTSSQAHELTRLPYVTIISGGYDERS